MGLYNIAVYKDDIYGEQPKLSFSVEPIRAIAIDYDAIRVSWRTPTGSLGTDFWDMRLVRSQDGYPETAEDGAILWSWKKDGNKNSILDDGNLDVAPLIKGRFTYYRFWVKKETGIWAIAGNAYTVVPKEHFTNIKLDPKYREEQLTEPYLSLQPNKTSNTEADISVVFNNAVDGTPDIADFTCKVNGISVTITDAIVGSSNPQAVILTVSLFTPLKDSDKIVVSYSGTTLSTVHVNPSGYEENVPVIAFTTFKLVGNKFTEEVALSTQDRLMDFIPRVFTTATQSPIDEVDKTSDLWKFLEGFALTLDEMMTLLDLTLPEESGRFWSPEVVSLAAIQMGIPLEPFLATKVQKALIREAFYYNPRKGTKLGIGSFAEALTGFAPTVSLSPNLLPTVQESTFYKGVGHWVGSGISAVSSPITSGDQRAYELLAIDDSWAMRISGATTVALGEESSDGAGGTGGSSTAGAHGPIIIGGGAVSESPASQTPIIWGIPVNPYIDYIFSGYTKTTGGDITAKVKFYGWNGGFIREVSHTIPATANYWPFSFSSKAPGTGVTSNVTSVDVPFDDNSGTTHTFTVTVDDATNFDAGLTVLLKNVDGTDDFSLDINNAICLITNIVGNDITLQIDKFVGSYFIRDVNLTIQEYTVPAYFASLSFTTGGATTYVDMLNFYAGTTGSPFEEPRAVKIVLAPSKVNYVSDPMFAGVGVWTGDTYTTSAAIPGAAEFAGAFEVVTQANSESYPLIDYTSNQFITASVSVNDFSETGATFSPGNVDVTVFLEAYYMDGLDEVILASKSTTKSYVENDSAVQIASTMYIPGGTQPYLLRMTVSGTAAAYIRYPQLELSSKPTDFIWGDSPASFGDAAVWAGSANGSPTLYYPGREIKFTRLAQELPNHIPFNTPYILYRESDDVPVVERKDYANPPLALP